ncbi:MAG: ribosomal protein S18-alanine N-acetyltransferase [Nitrospirae bacterium]|nr:ribosomal protein S18-alanine N-acetyltransferase [Nitrospirota bacterium]
MAIRPAREADLERLAAIERAAMGTARGLDVWHREFRAPAFHTWLAEGADGPVGYACVSVAADEGSLNHIAVHPGWRRRGVARALLAHVLGVLAAWGVTEVFLDVRAGNVAARALYRAADFDEVAVRPGYYADPPEDAVICRRRLAASAHG